ncbi:hypothetical protein GF373_13215 [bacterium]|nr:hypothetical protein [bacterium]
MKNPYIQYTLIFFVLFGIYAGLRSHTFFAPLAHDDGLFLYGGQAWAHGELPYRDFWDHKPPGIFFYHSLPFSLFSFNVMAAKWHEVLWLTLSATLLFAFCKRRFLLSTSFFCVAAYVFFTSAPYTIRTGGLTEENALFFVVLCFWLILRRKGDLLHNAFFSGLALGVAFEFRQTYLLDVPFVIGALLHNAHYRGEKFKDVLKPFFAIFVGMAIPEIVISLYFLLHGEWFTYFDSSYLNNFYYIGPARPSKPWLDVWTEHHWPFILATGPYLFAPVLALGTRQWVPKDIRWMYVPLILAFGGDFISISLSGEYYEHYYVQASVSSALLLAMFAEGLVQRGRQAWKEGILRFPSLRYAGIALLLVAITLSSWYSGILRYRSDYQRAWNHHTQDRGPYTFQRAVGEAVQAITAPDERILLIGRKPNSVYIFAGRYAGARYYHHSPLWKTKLYGSVKEYHKKAYMKDFRDNKPVVLILDQYIPREFRAEEDFGWFQTFLPEFEPYIKENYVYLDEAVDGYPDSWWWYDIMARFKIRKDCVDSIRQRLREIAPE